MTYIEAKQHRENILTLVEHGISSGQLCQELNKFVYAIPTNCNNCYYLDKGPYNICPYVDALERQCVTFDKDNFYCNKFKGR